MAKSFVCRRSPAGMAVMTDAISYADAFDQAIYLCEAGCMVIGATDGGDCQRILERLIFSRSRALSHSA